MTHQEPGDKMADDALRVAAHTIGSLMPDGSVFAGISPDSGKPMYTTQADAPLTITFNAAGEYARKLNIEKYLGYDNWHLPSKAELNVLFNNRAAIGGFCKGTSSTLDWYAAPDQDDSFFVWGQRFTDGYRGFYLNK